MKNLIIGAARSGLAAARYLLDQGQEVVLTDMDPQLQATIDQALASPAYQGIWGRQPDVAAIQPDRLIMSPGVPLDIPPVQAARKAGIPIISETELAYLEASCHFIAITGTNGKTTTSSWVARLLEDPGRQVVLGGNIGTPLISQVADLQSQDVIVAEMSSFQLESVHRFRPDVAAILNITPDHLDRHKTMKAYVEAKSHIFFRQGPEDVLVLHADDPILVDLARKAPSRVLGFSRQRKLDYGIYLQDTMLYYRLPGMDRAEALIDQKDLALPGVHNLENAMAAALVALSFGQTPDVVRQGLQDFQALAHRLEPVGTFGGVAYVNDSKGTNPDATEKALTAFHEPLILILGGVSKGTDLVPLAEKIQAGPIYAIVQGQASQDFVRAFAEVGFQDYQVEKDLFAATQAAKALAKPGDTVLLSPACASFDQFSDYEARGQAFKKWVNPDGS